MSYILFIYEIRLKITNKKLKVRVIDTPASAIVAVIFFS